MSRAATRKGHNPTQSGRQRVTSRKPSQPPSSTLKHKAILLLHEMHTAPQQPQNSSSSRDLEEERAFFGVASAMGMLQALRWLRHAWDHEEAPLPRTPLGVEHLRAGATPREGAGDSLHRKCRLPRLSRVSWATVCADGHASAERQFLRKVKIVPRQQNGLGASLQVK